VDLTLKKEFINIQIFFSKTGNDEFFPQRTKINQDVKMNFLSKAIILSNYFIPENEMMTFHQNPQY